MKRIGEKFFIDELLEAISEILPEKIKSEIPKVYDNLMPQYIYTVTVNNSGSKESVDIIGWYKSKDDAIYYVKQHIKELLEELNLDYNNNKKHIDDLNNALNEYNNSWVDGSWITLENAGLDIFINEVDNTLNKDIFDYYLE